MTDVNEIKENFDHFDKDGSGAIETSELLSLMRALGMDPSADDLAMAAEALDTNHNGRIEWTEFLSWWSDR
ncbi:MAG: hypothetical protein GY898_06175 [Proteobacteria bacterium]|nr:hypothetical protein [Pseudomonadota bacterium]